MNDEPVHVELIGTTLVVAINRPDVRNAVNGAVAAALAEAFRAFEENDDAKVAVLAGDGGTFCAGADLRAMGTRDANRVTSDGDGPMGPTLMTLRKPVIAAIDGYAVAGGMELALWCDLRVMEEDADRRWHGPATENRRRRTGRGSDPHRSSGRRDRGARHRPRESRRGTWSRPNGRAGLSRRDRFVSRGVHARGPALDVRRTRSTRIRGDGD